MKTTMLVSAGLAAAVGLTLFDATPTEAARRSVSVRTAPSRIGQARVRTVQPRVRNVQPRVLHTRKITKGTSSAFVKKGTSSAFVKKTTLGQGTLNLRRLPLHKAASSVTSDVHGRR